MYDIGIRRIPACRFAVAWAKPNRSAVPLCGVTTPFRARAGAERTTASGCWWLVLGSGWQDHRKTGATEMTSAWLHESCMNEKCNLWILVDTCGYLWIIHEHSVTFPMHRHGAFLLVLLSSVISAPIRWSRLPGWLGSHQHRWRSLSETQFQKFSHCIQSLIHWWWLLIIVGL